ncbi:MAG: DUF5752 family protein, partial [Acidobacteriia bacterium]|nr:DUF5752 family protein [Terriglobia bacterium]
QKPFDFVTAAYLTRICNEKAANLLELREGLEHCSDGAIFYNTFQSLGRYHFLTEGFSNEFAQWVLASCNCAELAEMLASLDIRDYLLLEDLRRDLRNIVDEYCAAHPTRATQIAFEPFYFCESIEVTVPLGIETTTLEDFCAVLKELNNASFQYHFITSRLRLQLRTNDFSMWFEDGLGLTTLAKRANQIDIYTNTLDSARFALLGLAEKEILQ